MHHKKASAYLLAQGNCLISVLMLRCARMCSRVDLLINSAGAQHHWQRLAQSTSHQETPPTASGGLLSAPHPADARSLSLSLSICIPNAPHVFTSFSIVRQLHAYCMRPRQPLLPQRGLFSANNKNGHQKRRDSGVPPSPRTARQERSEHSSRCCAPSRNNVLLIDSNRLERRGANILIYKKTPETSDRQQRDWRLGWRITVPKRWKINFHFFYSAVAR